MPQDRLGRRALRELHLRCAVLQRNASRQHDGVASNGAGDLYSLGHCIDIDRAEKLDTHLAAQVDAIDLLRGPHGESHIVFSGEPAIHTSPLPLRQPLDLDGYRRLEELGVTVLTTMPWLFYGGPTDSLQQKLDGLARFGEDVIAHFAS